MKPLFVSAVCVCCIAHALIQPTRTLLADDPTVTTQTKAVPTNRADMLAALEQLKQRTARLPLPPAEFVAQVAQEASSGTSTLGVVNNGLMRRFYLPAELSSGGFSRQPDPSMKLDNVTATELFWIVSRVNNCHYCLGHQEAKLKAAGVTEEQLWQLDTDWQTFPPAQQAAFAFSRKLTFAPHTITDADIDELKKHFAPAQVFEIAFLVARYNSTNRWTDSLGIPQESERDFRSDLPNASLAQPSQVAIKGFPPRELLTDYAQWQQAFRQAANRQSRLPLAEVSEDASELERLLKHFPLAGKQWLDQAQIAQTVGGLPSQLRDQVAYVAARGDNAWYMQHRARTALLKQGMTENEIFALATAAMPGESQASAPLRLSDSTLMALRFTFKLTTSPQSIGDSDIAELLKVYNPNQVAELIYRIGLAAFLNRVTEAAGLGWQRELPQAIDMPK